MTSVKHHWRNLTTLIAIFEEEGKHPMRFIIRISNSTLTSADLRASHEYFMETHVEYLATVTGAPLQSLSISAPPNQIGGTVSSIPTNSSVHNSATPQICQPKSSSTNQSTTPAQAAPLSSSTAQSMNNNTSSTPTTSSASSKGNGNMIDILERVVHTPATGSSGATNSHNQTEAMKANGPPQQQQSQAPTAAMKGNKITSNSMKKEKSTNNNSSNLQNHNGDHGGISPDIDQYLVGGDGVGDSHHHHHDSKHDNEENESENVTGKGKRSRRKKEIKPCEQATDFEKKRYRCGHVNPHSLPDAKGCCECIYYVPTLDGHETGNILMPDINTNHPKCNVYTCSIWRRYVGWITKNANQHLPQEARLPRSYKSMQEFVALLRDRYNKSPAHRAAVVPHMSHQYLTMVVYALMDSDEKGVPPQKEGQRNRSNNKQGKSSKGQQIISASDNDIEFYIEQQCQVCHTRYDDTMLACPQCTVFSNIAVIPNEQVEILWVYSRRLKK